MYSSKNMCTYYSLSITYFLCITLTLCWVILHAFCHLWIIFYSNTSMLKKLVISNINVTILKAPGKQELADVNDISHGLRCMV